MKVPFIKIIIFIVVAQLTPTLSYSGEATLPDGTTVDTLGFECTTKNMIKTLATTEEAYKKYGKAYSSDYTWNHMTNNWAFGILSGKSVIHQLDGGSHLSCRPFLFQVIIDEEIVI